MAGEPQLTEALLVVAARDGPRGVRVCSDRMLDDRDRDDLIALLAWWREAGVTYALEDEAIDWTARGDAAPGASFVLPGEPGGTVGAPTPSSSTGTRATTPASSAPRPPSSPSFVPPAPDRAGISPAQVRTTTAAPRQAAHPPIDTGNRREEPTHPPPRTLAPAMPTSGATMAAREAARRANSLDELEAALKSFEGCPLKATAKNLCFFRGNPHGRLMIIGEAPGREEDLEGRPFVGRAGQLLDRMLAAIGLSESDVHITNVVYWRPPGNRTPTLEEVEVCRPFLERQMELAGPELVMTLGGPAAKAIIGATDGILRVRGKWGRVQAGDRQLRVMPTLHPAYLLRTPAAKRHAWRDLLAVKLALEEGKGDPQ